MGARRDFDGGGAVGGQLPVPAPSSSYVPGLRLGECCSSSGSRRSQWLKYYRTQGRDILSDPHLQFMAQSVAPSQSFIKTHGNGKENTFYNTMDPATSTDSGHTSIYSCPLPVFHRSMARGHCTNTFFCNLTAQSNGVLR